MLFLQNKTSDKINMIPPSCHLKYYEMSHPMSRMRYEKVYRHIKARIQKAMLEDTNRETLSKEQKESLDKVTLENLPAFLLRSKACRIFDLCDPQDFACVTTCDSATSRGEIGFVVEVPQARWKEDNWDESPLPEGVPFMWVETGLGGAFYKALKKVKCKGYLITKSNNKKELISEQNYLRQFTPRQKQLCLKNDGWYSKRGNKCNRTQRPKFQYFSWEQPDVCNLLFCFFSGLHC